MIDLAQAPTPVAPPGGSEERPLQLSQSRIKALTDEQVCPKRYYHTEITGEFENPPSLSMLKGQLFEWLALGSRNRAGQVPVLPRNRNGRPTADELRIREQAAEFKRLMPLYKIEILDKRVPITVPLRMTKDGTRVDLSGLLDVLVAYQNRPYILDLKLAANCYATWGDFCWGEFWRMDHLQASAYTEMLQLATGHNVGFLYAVFDYKPQPDHQLIDVPYSPLRRAELYTRLQQAIDNYRYFDARGWEAVPSWAKCQNCPVVDCTQRTRVKQVRVLGI